MGDRRLEIINHEAFIYMRKFTACRATRSSVCVQQESWMTADVVDVLHAGWISNDSIIRCGGVRRHRKDAKKKKILAAHLEV